ncbi:MAG: hypothetical protein GPJ54_11090 [Candidatus Heimdallarchaeota archaeon]|nr:hypothetical protein [Candidatus Heimdallarchaeota archaeon]
MPDQARSYKFERLFPYSQGLLMIPSVYVLILVIWSFNLILIRSDPSYFEISAGISPLYLFFYYAVYSLIVYPATARVSNNKLLRNGVDHTQIWLTRRRRLAFFHTFSYGMFSLFMLIGSFAVVRIGTSQQTLNEKPANGIELSTTLFYILVSTFVYYFGIRRLWTHVNGRDL